MTSVNDLKPDYERIDDLAQFARIELDSRDVEPWADMIAELQRSGACTEQETTWALTLYNTYDSIESAFSVLDRWPSPDAWDNAADKNDAADYQCTQERRGLRGGRVLRRFQTYVDALGGMDELAWMRQAIVGDDPGKDFERLTTLMRSVWGVGRQSAFEWAEFVEKCHGWDIDCDDAQLWESEGPRRSLQRLYGNPNPTSAWLDNAAHQCKQDLEDRGVNLRWVDFETIICDFNVMRDGRYYPGRHLAALAEEIETAPPAWRPRLRAAWDEIVPDDWRNIAPGIDPAKMPIYRDTGRIISEA